MPSKSSIVNSLEDYQYLVVTVTNHFMPDSRREDFLAVGNLALVEAWGNRPLDNEDKLLIYLVGCIKHAILDYQEEDHLIRIPYRSLNRLGLEQIKLCSAEDVQVERYDDSLMSLINDLPIEDKELVLLFVEGYNLREIAEKRNCSIPGVQYKLNKIRVALKKYFYSGDL